MRSVNTIAAFILVLVFASLAAAGCVGVPQDVPGGAAPLGVDEATFAVIDFSRTGAPDNPDASAVMYLDGHVVLEVAGDEPLTFQLSAAAQDQIEAAFEAADFFANARTALTPTPAPDGATAYEISRRGLLLQGSLLTSDATAPEWARPLIPLLDNLLLTPDPATVTPYRPGQPAPTAMASASVTPPAAPSMVLVRFTRRGADGDERVLLNLDRSYSVARGGEVTEGSLSEREMATLLKVLEDANLRQQAGDYFSESDCTGCTEYELVYRNVFGEHVVRTAAGQEPDWLAIALDALTAQFLAPLPVVAVPATATSQPVAVASATDTPLSQPSPTAMATAGATPTATATIAAPPANSPTPVVPSPAPTMTVTQYSTLDLLADLANVGAQVEVAPGRVVKPYLTTYGLIVRVDGEPIQVFQYADEASLLADVDGLDTSGTSIDGLPLAWPAAPHFWRRGSLLALAVTDEQYYVDLVSQVLGAPFAGQ